MQFISKWLYVQHKFVDQPRANSLCQRVSLKPRIEELILKIDAQIINFNSIIHELKTIYDNLLNERQLSIKENNSQYSTLISADIINSTRIIKTLHLSKIAFEKLKNKLQRISNFEDIVIGLAPAMTIVKNIRASLIQCIPESQEELGSISELIGCILIDAGQIGGYTINFKAANDEALRLLNEASLSAVQNINKFYSISD